MSVPAFLAELRNRDIGLWVDGDRLRCDAPAGVLTPELRDQLQQRKSEILEFLRGPTELSFSQERLWFLDQIDPGGSAYVIANKFTIGGALDTPALERALEALVGRHESLRTIFANVEGRPLQVVLEPGRWTLSVEDLSGEADKGQSLEKRLREEVSLGFDLARGPLFRARLYRLAPDAHVLLLVMHHIVSDAWSMGVLIRELGELYDGFSRGEPATLPALRLQYRDFARWQRNRLQGEVLNGLLAHWCSRIAGAPQMLELPTDRPRPPVMTYRGARYSFALPLKLVDGLRALARREEATLFMTLLTGFSLLLSRCSGQQDLLVGTPVANRSRTEFDGVVGFFVDTLVLRADLSGELSVRLLLARMREVCLDALAHQELPFERLVEELKPARDMSRNPLFQVMFVLQNVAQRALELPGLTLSPLDVSAGGAQFDLTLEMRETTAGLNGVFEYSTDLFDESTIARMGAHLRSLLEAMVATPERSVWELPLLTESERHQVLVEWNRTDLVFDGDMRLHRLFEQQVARTPDAEALVFISERLTYDELNRRANRLAHQLRALGAGPDKFVGVCLRRSSDLIVALFAVLKSGAAYVPLDLAYPAARIALMLENSQATVLVTTSDVADALPPSEARRVCLDQNESGGKYPDSNPDNGAAPEHLAYVIYTSGSTGVPKGVAIEHRNAATLVHWARTVFTDAELRGVLASTSICFDLSVFEIFFPLAFGGRVILAENALQLPELPARGEVTLVNTVPSAAAELVRMNGLPSSVITVCLAGELLPTRLVDQLYGTGAVQRVYDLYGPSEDTTYSTYTLRKAGVAATIGRPIANTRAYVLDTRMNPVPVGVPGELYLGGDGLARGYLGRPDLTRERFLQDPFRGGAKHRVYRTGDLVRYLQDGQIEYLGRLDHQVKIRGFRIELGEIEAGIAQHPAVREVVVIVREDVPGDKRLVAYIVAESPPADLIDQLRALIRSKMPEYMVPAHFVGLDALPLTPNGKIDRKALPSPHASEHTWSSGSYVAPRNDLEISLAAAWERVLGVQRVGLTDDFFELGGNSLSVIKLIFEMKQATGFEIDLGEIFRSPTISGLVSSLGANATKNASVVVPLQPEGSGLPVFCICGINIYKDFAESLGKDQPVYGVYVAEEQAIVNQVISGERPEVSIDRLVEAYYKAITRFQPHGPYRLAGLSFGGILAIELASKMRMNGAEVEVVFLLDAVLPKAIHRNLAKWISYQVTEILKGDGLKTIHRLFSRFRNGFPMRGLQSGIQNHESQIDGKFRLKQAAAFLIAAEQWRAHPSICDFRVILFRATDLSMQGPHVEFDEDLGWRRYLGDWLRIVDVIGGHRGIIEPPNVTELGRKARQYLGAQ